MNNVFDELEIFFDGGSRGNPGIAGYGAAIFTPNKAQKIVEAYGYLGEVTNNNAEYNGLLAGLRIAYQINPEAKIKVYADSKLVVEQMSGRWKIKDENLKIIAQEACKIFPLQQVEYFWIPREKNKEADKLANTAMDSQSTDTIWFLDVKQSTHNNSGDEIPKEELENTFQNKNTTTFVVVNTHSPSTLTKEDENKILEILKNYEINSLDKIFTVNERIDSLFTNTEYEVKKLSELLSDFYNTTFYKTINKNILIILQNSVTKTVLNHHIQAILANYIPENNGVNILEISKEGKKNKIVALGIKL